MPPSETTYLLQDGDINNGSATPPKERQEFPEKAAPIWLLLGAITFVNSFGGVLGDAAQTQILEEIICRQYSIEAGTRLSGLSTNHQHCKIEPVQSELAIINAWGDTFAIIPSIALALPYSVFADRIGRRPVLLLGILGCTLAQASSIGICWFGNVLPVRLVWLSVVFYIIGGGPCTADSMIFLILAEACAVDTRATAFSRIHAAALLSQVIATPLCAFLMSINPWIPVLVGLAISCLGLSLVALVPETLPAWKRRPHLSKSAEDPTDGDVDPCPLSLSKRFQSTMQDLSSAIHLVKGNPNLGLILFSFLVANLGSQMTSIFLQYSSIKLHWTIAKTTYLLSFHGAASITALLVLLPFITNLLSKTLHLNHTGRDKYLTQGSTALLVCGCITIFLSNSPPVLGLGIITVALGGTAQVTARSLASLLVKPEALGTTYAAIAVITSLGMMVAGPLVAATFKRGLLLGGDWLGLPFLMAAGLYTVAFGAVGFVRWKGVQVDC